MQAPEPVNVLFLCTGNSARSILGEAILNKVGSGHYRGFSAGSFPKGQVHPQSLRLLQRLGHQTETLRSKSWDEFALPGAPVMHFIITVCDQAGGEVCPIWPGQPISAHWGLPDPAAALGEEAEVAAAFERTYHVLDKRLQAFVAALEQADDPMDVKAHMAQIGSGAYDP